MTTATEPERYVYENMYLYKDVYIIVYVMFIC